MLKKAGSSLSDRLGLKAGKTIPIEEPEGPP